MFERAAPAEDTEEEPTPHRLPSSVHFTSITSVCALCRFVSSRTAAEQLRHGVAELADQWRRHMSLQGVLDAHEPEADLGMFSMFGRTGAPTKRRPPQKDNTPSLAYSLLQKGWPQTASQLLLQ